MSDIQFLYLCLLIAFIVACFVFKDMLNNKTITVTKEEKTHLSLNEKT
jgi:hypothetical protein